MNIEVIAIGEELLKGSTINSNAAFLSRELTKLGYKISRHSVISDNEEMLTANLEESLSHFDLVITTGGLGPTYDDKTKTAISKLFNMPLIHDEQLEREIYERFQENKYKREQALIPKGAMILENKIGTAPGFIFEKEKKVVIALPGVPYEMEKMFFSYVVDFIKDKFKIEKKLFQETVNICLKNEDEVEKELEKIRKMDKDIDIGIYPNYATLRVSFTATEKDEEKAKAKIYPLKHKLEEKFSKYIFPEQYDDIQEAVKDIFILKKKKLALAESCTGGALSASLTKLPDASVFLLGSIVSYSNEMKRNILKVKENTLREKGAVSIETVGEMAASLFQSSAADYSVAISGIAGPGGGDKNKPVGTVCFAIAERDKVSDKGKIYIPGDRSFVINYSVSFALSLLWVRINHNLTYFN